MATRHSITHNTLYWMTLGHGCLRGRSTEWNCSEVHSKGANTQKVRRARELPGEVGIGEWTHGLGDGEFLGQRAPKHW